MWFGAVTVTVIVAVPDVVPGVCVTVPVVPLLDTLAVQIAELDVATVNVGVWLFTTVVFTVNDPLVG